MTKYNSVQMNRLWSSFLSVSTSFAVSLSSHPSPRPRLLWSQQHSLRRLWVRSCPYQRRQTSKREQNNRFPTSPSFKTTIFTPWISVWIKISNWMKNCLKTFIRIYCLLVLFPRQQKIYIYIISIEDSIMRVRSGPLPLKNVVKMVCQEPCETDGIDIYKAMNSTPLTTTLLTTDNKLYTNVYRTVWFLIEIDQ